jgi:hypothetical protein
MCHTLADKWSAPVGTCYSDPRVCSSTPISIPAGPNSLRWPMGNIFPTGGVIEAGCKNNYVGKLPACKMLELQQ